MSRCTTCVKCQEEYRPLKNGIFVVFSVNGEYDCIYSADLWICPVCDNKIITGYGSDAICFSCEENWDKYLENPNYEKIYINLKRK